MPTQNKLKVHGTSVTFTIFTSEESVIFQVFSLIVCSELQCSESSEVAQIP